MAVFGWLVARHGWLVAALFSVPDGYTMLPAHTTPASASQRWQLRRTGCIFLSTRSISL